MNRSSFIACALAGLVSIAANTCYADELSVTDPGRRNPQNMTPKVFVYPDTISVHIPSDVPQEHLMELKKVDLDLKAVEFTGNSAYEHNELMGVIQPYLAETKTLYDAWRLASIVRGTMVCSQETGD